MTGTPKSPRERAQEALAITERKRNRAAVKFDAATAAAKKLEAELDELDTRLDYLRRDPALPPAEPVQTPRRPIADSPQA